MKANRSKNIRGVEMRLISDLYRNATKRHSAGIQKLKINNHDFNSALEEFLLCILFF